MNPSLSRFLNPKHIAVLGGDDAELVIRELQKSGFAGHIQAINRSRKKLANIECIKDIQELTDVPDALFLGISGEKSIELVQELSDQGCGGVACFAAGFAETGVLGSKLQDQLNQAAGTMPLLGPNCYGYINAIDSCSLWPYFQGCRPVHSGPALISQSGMLATSLTLNRRSVDYSYVVSIGNQAQLGTEDFIEHFLKVDAVTSFSVYQEGFRDFNKFQKVSDLALQCGKPIVMIKGGQCPNSQTIANNHTGMFPEQVNVSVEKLKELGIIIVESSTQLLETTKLLSGRHPVRGHKIVAFTCSGGDASILADIAEKSGLVFPEPPIEVIQRLKKWLPSIATAHNPLDCTTQLWGKPDIHNIFSTMITKEQDVAIFVQDYPGPDISFDYETDFAEAASFIHAANRVGIPAIICSNVPENLNKKVREFVLNQNGIPLQGISETIGAILDTHHYNTISKH